MTTRREAGCEKLPPALREQCEKKQKEGEKSKKDDADKTEKEASQAARVAARYQRQGSLPKRVAARYQRQASRQKTEFTSDSIRVSWWDHPANRLVIEEMPGKPFKRKLRRHTFDTGNLVQWISPSHGGGGRFLMENILQDAKLSKSMSYDAAVKAAEKALEKAKDEAKDSAGGHYDDAWFKKMGWPIGHENEVSYLDVSPQDYEPIRFKGKDFSGESKWTEFTFYADRDEDEYMRQMEGMQTFYKSKSSGGARKLFKILKADPALVKSMTVDQFTGLLAKNKIAYTYVPTVWR